MIEVKSLTKKFLLPNSTNAENSDNAAPFLSVLTNVTFKIERGTWTSLTGSSGSGKSTLLTLLAGLDVPSEGSVIIEGQDLSLMSEDERSDFRAHHMGFIFQSFRLLPHLTALENVAVPLQILGHSDATARAQTMLERVGMGHRLSNQPGQLSGGEQQRVAVARAFVTQPKILFADEPTGNLDSKNGENVLALMKELHQEQGSTLIVVTHDPFVAGFGQRQIRLKDGQMF